jgi:UPF0716 family protein affecting phage T7 exclusion
MLNLLFYLGCLLLLVKGIELMRVALTDPTGSMPRKLAMAGGLIAIFGSILFLIAGEYVAGLARGVAD